MALFDFTSLFAAEHSSRIIRHHGKTLLLMLAGDSLLEVTMVTTCVTIGNYLTPIHSHFGLLVLDLLVVSWEQWMQLG